MQYIHYTLSYILLYYTPVYYYMLIHVYMSIYKTNPVYRRCGYTRGDLELGLKAAPGRDGGHTSG